MAGAVSSEAVLPVFPAESEARFLLPALPEEFLLPLEPPPLAKDVGVSVVIPAYNEERRLPSTLSRYLTAFEALGRPFEVIVVVDGCKDRTAEIAQSFGHRHVRVLEFSQRLGKGGAVKEGIRAAQFGYVGYLDADGPIPSFEISPLLEGLEHADCVVASRALPGSRIIEAQPLQRVLMGRMWNALARGLLLLPLKDTQCGAKFFRRDVALEALKQVTVTNWAFDVSLLFHIWKGGHAVLEVPTTWSHCHESHLRPMKAVPPMLLSLVGIRFMSLPFAGRRIHEIGERLYAHFSSH